MPTPLSSRFSDVDAKQHGNVWAKLWEDSQTPWDRSQASPALVDLIEHDKVKLFDDQSDNGRVALVPGCGRGYDVYFLANNLRKYGFHKAVGLEISEGAVKAAAEYFAKQQQQRKGDEATDSSTSAASANDASPTDASVVLGDFFDETQSWSTGKKYDLVYDYTFLCALPPSRRPDWARRMSEVIAPRGVLITLQHPLDAGHGGGPPFSLTTELYDELLLSQGFKRIYREKPGKSFDLEMSKKDLIAVFRRTE
ncbi:hypothetical protein PYCC9005_000821 [Savitreella phatthalungensis]